MRRTDSETELRSGPSETVQMTEYLSEPTREYLWEPETVHGTPQSRSSRRDAFVGRFVCGSTILLFSSLR